METTYIELEDGKMLCTKTDVTEVVKEEGDSTDIILLVSTEREDSDGDIIHQRRSKKGSGWVLDHFNGAPLITWRHDTWTPNLSGPKTQAKVKKHATKGQGLHLEPLQFDSGDDFAMSLDGKIRREVLKESSVGFRLLEREPRRDENGRQTGLDIYGAELIEVAIVNRGANSETEVLAKRFMTNPALAGQVEGAGFAEITEMKADVEHLSSEVAFLVKTIKALGDKVDGEVTQEFLRVQEDKEKQEKELSSAAGQMLQSLKDIGTAHS